MRAIGYYRFKTSQVSIEDLEASFNEYCDLYLHQPVKVFNDCGVGTKQEFTEYHHMVKFLSGDSEFLVVVPDARHLGENLESAARTIVELNDKGAQVICDEENYPDPIQNSLRLLSMEGTSNTRSERVKEAMRNKALRAKTLGKPPYGYINSSEGKLEINTRESPVIELIYRMYSKDDMGIRLITQHLNERGITTRRGGKWNMITIRDMLRNPTYMGTYTRFGLRLSKSHDPIISPDQFRQAQDTNRSRRPTGRFVNAEPFLLSGLLLCGYCDNKMMGVTRRQSWKLKNGRRSRGVYRYYQCQSRNNLSVCKYHTWRSSLLEQTVITQVKLSMAAHPNTVNDTDLSSNTNRGEILSRWNDRVKNAERRLNNAMKRIARAEMKLEKLSEYISDLDNNRKGAERAENPMNVKANLNRWENLTFNDKQNLLMETVSRIIVKDEAIEVVI